jgi:hypothetical protein
LPPRDGSGTLWSGRRPAAGAQTEVSVSKLNVKQIVITLILVFVVLAIWNDPQSSASTAGDFLGKVGHFISALIDKAATFVKGLHG